MHEIDKIEIDKMFGRCISQYHRSRNGGGNYT